MARFKSFEQELARRGGVSNARKVAQQIGRASNSERGEYKDSSAPETYAPTNRNVSGRRRNPR